LPPVSAVDIAVDDPAVAASGGLTARALVLLTLPATWIALIDGALILLFGAISPEHVFFNVGNFKNIALDSAEITILAAGIAMLLGAAELDISLGANVILSSVLGGKAMVAMSGTSAEVANGEYPQLARGILVGVAVAVVTGACFGLVNGLIVTRMRVNSFITTLGTLGIGTGIALVVTGGTDLEDVPPGFQSDFGVKNVVWQVPAPVLVALVIVAILWFVTAKTRFGLRTVAIGSSREAANRAGLKTSLHLLALFVLVGTLAGVAGVIDLSRFSTTNLSGHQTDALSAIAGAVIGGTSLFGGRISIIGAVFGAILASILETGLVIQGLDPFYQLIAVGVVLIVAVYIRGRDVEGRRGVLRGFAASLADRRLKRSPEPSIEGRNT
jgi:ribose transport system permease protein